MREHLLGYLLGALDPEEHQHVERAVRENGDLQRGDSKPDDVKQNGLQRDLDALRQCLAPLTWDQGQLEPPLGLALRTCRFVALQTQTVSLASAAGSSRWRFADMIVAAGVCLAASMLFFPAVSHSRYNAQLAGCQNNFRHIGRALAGYADFNGGRLPQIPQTGPRAVAGIVAPTLVSQGYLEEPERFVCPARAASRKEPFRIATFDELDRAEPKQRRPLQRNLSGDYGYNLGVMHNGRYQGLRTMGRSTFAVMADSPCLKLGTRQSANHGGCGQNVLFDDGHVDFRRKCLHESVGDDYFRNDEGYVSAGTHINDAVIGRSDSPPLIFTSADE